MLWVSYFIKKVKDIIASSRFEFIDSKYRHIARDKDGKLVFMAESKSWLQMVQDNFPDIHFHFISEF